MTLISSLSTHGNILSHPFLETCLHPVSSLLSNPLQQIITFSQNQSRSPTLPAKTASDTSVHSVPLSLHLAAHAFLTLPFSFVSHNSSKCIWISPFNPSGWSPSWFSCQDQSWLILEKIVLEGQIDFPKLICPTEHLPMGSCQADHWKNQSLLPSKQSFIQLLACFTPFCIWNSTNPCHCNQHSHWVPQPLLLVTVKMQIQQMPSFNEEELENIQV